MADEPNFNMGNYRGLLSSVTGIRNQVNVMITELLEIIEGKQNPSVARIESETNTLNRQMENVRQAVYRIIEDKDLRDWKEGKSKKK